MESLGYVRNHIRTPSLPALFRANPVRGGNVVRTYACTYCD